MAVVTVVVVPVVVTAIEVQVVRIVAVGAIKRTRPIVAVGALVVDFRTIAVARCGQASKTVSGLNVNKGSSDSLTDVFNKFPATALLFNIIFTIPLT